MDDFWDLIDVLGGQITPKGLRGLRKHLSALPLSRLEAFGETFAKAVYDLDTLEHYQQPIVVDEHDDVPEESSPDEFRERRIAAVAAGRQAYEVILADPAALQGITQNRLTDAEDLVELLDERLDGYAPAHGMETGDNPAGFQDAVYEPRAVESESEVRWLSPGYVFTDGAVSDKYAHGPGERLFDQATFAAVVAVNRDTALQERFAKLECRFVNLNVDIISARQKGRIRVRRRPNDEIDVDVEAPFTPANPDAAAIEAWMSGVIENGLSFAIRRLA